MIMSGCLDHSDQSARAIFLKTWTSYYDCSKGTLQASQAPCCAPLILQTVATSQTGAYVNSAELDTQMCGIKTHQLHPLWIIWLGEGGRWTVREQATRLNNTS
jgi:hypothetical protein